MDLLENLAQDYSLYVLSNTNVIHVRTFHDKLQQTGKLETFRGCFKKVYYSCEIMMAKPDPAIFRYVLEENNLIALQTLLVDDSSENTEAAARLGMEVLEVKDPAILHDFFNDGNQ